MEKLDTLDYRQTRAALREAQSRVLDALYALHGAMTRGDAHWAKEAARKLALAADDVQALCERVVRLVNHQAAL